MNPSADRSPASGGLFVTFEGVEGSGKSTQIGRLVRRLRGAGREVVSTREPGGTELGNRLRAVLLEQRTIPMEPLVELLLYAADRAQHVREVIRPALERGALVLCDRYLDASLSYQGYGRRLGTDLILEIHSRPPLDLRPHRTILLDLDPFEGLTRARSRNQAHGLSQSEGRFEEEDLEFHRRIRDGYLELAREEPERFRVVAASGNRDEVGAGVVAALSDVVAFPPLEDGT